MYAWQDWKIHSSSLCPAISGLYFALNLFLPTMLRNSTMRRRRLLWETRIFRSDVHARYLHFSMQHGHAGHSTQHTHAHVTTPHTSMWRKTGGPFLDHRVERCEQAKAGRGGCCTNWRGVLQNGAAHSTQHTHAHAPTLCSTECAGHSTQHRQAH